MSWQRPNIGSRVTREGHARFWERLEVKFLRATQHPRPRRSKPHDRECLLRPESDRRKSKCDPPLRATNRLIHRSKRRAPVVVIYLITSSAPGIRRMVRFLRRRICGQGRALTFMGVAETFVALNRGPRVAPMDI